MKVLSVDIETFSEIDIKKAGGYRYALDAQVMLFGYSIDHSEAECYDLMSEGPLPDKLVYALFDPKVKKTAHNAAFERAVLRTYFESALYVRSVDPSLAPAWEENTWKLIAITDGYLPVEQWKCSQVSCARAGYPLSLDEASKAMGLIQKKDPRGAALIRLFSVPCKPTKTNGGRTRNLPEHFPQEWEEFKEYCKQDVVTEQAISKFLEWVPVSDIEHTYWHENEKMNERGLRVDLDMVEGAVQVDTDLKEVLLGEAVELTSLENPNSRNQMLGWLNENGGFQAETLTKESVKDMLEESENPEVSKVLELRQELAKSSVKKYSAILASVCPDSRIRGTVQFGGAVRTLRNSGRIVQPQNLARILMGEKELDLAREIVKTGDAETLSMLWEAPSDVLSQLIRTAITASEGNVLYVVDYSSIEARFAAWVAEEDWALEVFNSHGKIYEATASRMFHVPIEQITKDSPLRQQGKTASLALQYQGGVNALTVMDFNKQIDDEDKPKLVKLWREANPNIVGMWYALDRAAIAAIKNPGSVFKVGKKGLAFSVRKNVLLSRLPSGRLLHYPRPHLTVNRWGGDSIGFYGMEQQSRKWTKSETYGGKLFENICQSGSRDLLMNGQHNAIAGGYSPILNVHDEIVCEQERGFGSVEELVKLMCQKPAWAEGLPLNAEGFETEYYNK